MVDAVKNQTGGGAAGGNAIVGVKRFGKEVFNVVDFDALSREQKSRCAPDLVERMATEARI